MSEKPGKSVFKHLDFIVLDMLCLQIAFVLAFWMTRGFGDPFPTFSFRLLDMVLIMAQLCTILFGRNYSGILRRGYLREAHKTAIYTLTILMMSVLILFVMHVGTTVSRLQLGWTLVLFMPLSFIIRQLRKRALYRGLTKEKDAFRVSLVLITSKNLVDEALHSLRNEEIYNDRYTSGIILMDGGAEEVQDKYDIPVVDLDRSAIKRLRSKWVDEVLIYQPSYMDIDRELINDLADMGMTTHFTLALFNDKDWPPTTVQKVGALNVLTSGLSLITPQMAVIKRAGDIIGGLIGSLITCILFIFVAPAIYIQSPGPIFFMQERIGKGGKPFKMYKFRSMYLDAEERKAQLMEQNKMQGLMFKMDDDPRIIGSEKKDKNGKPKGIGNFIRNTSIDEFPQFFNVVKGDMSLVGTRPPTVEEFQQYDIHHRARMTIKPGITGLWQTSGRNEITDFEQVVKLDREYIENWSVMLDIKILFKTVIVVAKRKGAN